MHLSEARKLSGTVWFLILGTMLSKASYFISMPFLALKMKTALDLNPVLIGLTLGLGPLVGVFAGFYVGHLSDRLGRKSIFSTSILLWSATFIGFGLATEYWHFAALNMLNGLFNSINQPVSAALISDQTETSLRKTAFHLRYFAINLGASFGPLVGAWLLLTDPSLGFFMTAAVYLLYGVACLFRLPSDKTAAGAARGTTSATFGETFKAISEDKPLLHFTLAFMLMGLTYSQLESTLPQFLQGAQGEAGIKLFGLLIAINAMTVVVFQLPITRLMARFSLLTTVKSGSVIYGVGFALIGFATGNVIACILSMILLTLGEILIFSNGNLLIDQIAPEDKKGAYFGAGGLWAVGASVGPGLGGYVLMFAGGKTLFIVAGLVAISNAWVYTLGQRAQVERRRRELAAGALPA